MGKTLSLHTIINSTEHTHHLVNSVVRRRPRSKEAGVCCTIIFISCASAGEQHPLRRDRQRCVMCRACYLPGTGPVARSASNGGLNTGTPGGCTTRADAVGEDCTFNWLWEYCQGAGAKVTNIILDTRLRSKINPCIPTSYSCLDRELA